MIVLSIGMEGGIERRLLKEGVKKAIEEVFFGRRGRCAF